MKTFSLSMGLKFAALAFVAAIRLDAQTSVRIALQASDGHWVCAELIGGRAVVANRNGWGPWETFNVRDFNGGPLKSRTLKVSHGDRKSTRLNSSHQIISDALFFLEKKKI